MDERVTQELLLEMLVSTVTGKTEGRTVNRELTPEAIASVYCLAKKHSLSHIVSRYVFQNGITVDGKLAAELRRGEISAVFQHERMKHAYREICDTFEKSRIPYIPLKGAVIREYYPQPEIRTSCDIDILVREKNLEAAIAALQEKGYQRGAKAYHDVSLYAPNGIHLELHFNILENRENLDRVLSCSWEYAEPADGSRYTFKKEFFVFHIYAHMAYHFLSGGCGIRSLMDLWVLEQRMGADYRCGKALLEKAGIYRFAEEMSRLASRCFDQRGYTDPVLGYIWRGGVYGSLKNRLSVQKKKTGRTVLFTMRLIFLPYKTMTIRYPRLKKMPFLLPFCWIHRLVKAVFDGKTRKYTREIACYEAVSNSNLEEITDILTRLGL